MEVAISQGFKTLRGCQKTDADLRLTRLSQLSTSVVWQPLKEAVM